MIWMEVRKEDAVYRERIKADRSIPRTAPEPRSKTSVSPAARTTTQLWRLSEARDYGTGPYDGDLDVYRSLRSNLAFQQQHARACEPSLVGLFARFSGRWLHSLRVRALGMGSGATLRFVQC